MTACQVLEARLLRLVQHIFERLVSKTMRMKLWPHLAQIQEIVVHQWKLMILIYPLEASIIQSVKRVLATHPSQQNCHPLIYHQPHREKHIHQIHLLLYNRQILLRRYPLHHLHHHQLPAESLLY